MADRVLVIAPHPDDEVLGCGGTIAKVAAGRCDVQIAYLTSGEHGSRDLPASELAALREREARDAMSILGVGSRQLTFLRIADGLISPYDQDQVGAVIRLLREARPTRAYLPHAEDGSFDHQAAHQLVMRAAAMAGSGNFPDLGRAHWVPTMLGYEVWAPIPQPTYLEDIGEYASAKLAALGCYSSQASKGRDQATYAGPAGLALSAFRGAVTTGGYREAFSVLRLGQVIP